MKLYKLVQVMQYVIDNGVSKHSDLYAKGNGELALVPMEQLAKEVHERLLKWGFIMYDGEYIYRP